MTPEKLALFEKCYRNWNGTSLMQGAFAELLAEVKGAHPRNDVIEECAQVLDRAAGSRSRFTVKASYDRLVIQENEINARAIRALKQ